MIRPVYFRLNISSIRCVTIKPPTQLMVANTTARKPSVVASIVSFVPAAKIAPMIVIPEIAFDPDISGV